MTAWEYLDKHPLVPMVLGLLYVSTLAVVSSLAFIAISDLHFRRLGR